jgi:hypothetical protein
MGVINLWHIVTASRQQENGKQGEYDNFFH